MLVNDEENEDPPTAQVENLARRNHDAYDSDGDGLKPNQDSIYHISHEILFFYENITLY